MSLHFALEIHPAPVLSGGHARLRPSLAYFVVMGSAVAFGVVPCAHMYRQCEHFGGAVATERALAGMFGNYFVGWLLLVSRFPERLSPGLFDIVGHSHQWWHLFVFLAGRTWLLALLDLNAANRAGPAG